MKRFLKWIGIVFGALIGLLLVTGIVMYVLGTFQLNKVYDFPPSNLVLPTDQASLDYGKHRVEVLCQGCHGPDLGGINNWFAAAPLGTIDSANLTSGEGGIGREFTSTEDYVRAIRHGIDTQGKGLYMPAVTSTSYLSDSDLASIIAYIKTVPPVDHKTNARKFTPLAIIMYTAGVLGKMPVETVSHDVHVSAPERGVSAAYGEYLVNTHDCRLCHGQQLAGGKHANPTVKLITPNLTPGGEVGFWTETQFIEVIRTGGTPSGHKLDPALMPWDFYRRFTDDELRAIFEYLRSLPKLPQYRSN